MPSPTEEKSSLVIFISENPEYRPGQTIDWDDNIRFGGPTPFKILADPKEPWQIHFTDVEPGTYTIQSRVVKWKDGTLDDRPFRKYSFEVKPGTIYLSPIKISDYQELSGESLA